jgi:hypothetical protein
MVFLDDDTKLVQIRRNIIPAARVLLKLPNFLCRLNNLPHYYIGDSIFKCFIYKITNINNIKINKKGGWSRFEHVL